MMKIQTYLTFNGNCEEAFRQYEKVLRGKIVMMMPHEGSPAAGDVPPEWQKKILHVRLQVGDQVLMASDAPPQYHSKAQGFSVSLMFTDVAEAERVFTELSDGATIQMPFGETFWALRFGMLVDRFGTPWMVNVEKPAA